MSMPCSVSSRERSRPAGPAPMIPTWVRTAPSVTGGYVAGEPDPSGQRKSRVRASSRPMPRAATSSTGTSRGEVAAVRRDDDAERGDDDRSAAAARPAPARPARPRRATSPPRCGRSGGGAPRRARGASGPGSTTVCRVCRVSERSACSTTSGGAAASSTLPTPVACSGSRLPTWLTTGTDSRPEIRST